MGESLDGSASNKFTSTIVNEDGFINAFEFEIRYPSVDLDHDAIKASEVLMLSSEPFPFKKKHIKEF